LLLFSSTHAPNQNNDVILSEVTSGNEVEEPAVAFALAVALALVFLVVIPEGKLLLHLL